jgi:hypothetical protein
MRTVFDSRLKSLFRGCSAIGLIALLATALTTGCGGGEATIAIKLNGVKLAASDTDEGAFWFQVAAYPATQDGLLDCPSFLSRIARNGLPPLGHSASLAWASTAKTPGVIGTVPKVAHAYVAVAKSAKCVTLAVGCTNKTVGTSKVDVAPEGGDVIPITLKQVNGGAACAAVESASVRCSYGRCVASSAAAATEGGGEVPAASYQPILSSQASPSAANPTSDGTLLTVAVGDESP